MGYFFLNSNPQELVISYNRNENKNDSNINIPTELKYITLGGILDIYLIVEKSPMRVIKSYQNLIGLPQLPPFWGLGWHQSRWGYYDLDQISITSMNYLMTKMPIDALWIDIDYMKRYNVFNVFKTFHNVGNMSRFLNLNNIKLVMIANPFISANKLNRNYIIGKEIFKAFIYSNYTKNCLVGKAWPGKSVYIDFFTKNGNMFWKFLLKKFEKKVQFDGIWLDMNEPSNFENEELLKVKTHNTIYMINKDGLALKRICNFYERFNFLNIYPKCFLGEYIFNISFHTHLPKQKIDLILQKDLDFKFNFYRNFTYYPGNGYIDLNSKSICKYF